MTNFLPAELQEVLAPQTKTDQVAAFGEATNSFVHVPTLKFLSSSSEIVKRGDAPVNSYQLQSKDKVGNLGKEVDALLLCVRATAMDNSGEKCAFNHDPDSPEFLAIVEKADNPPRDERGDKINTGHAYGPEVLVYLPEQNTLATFWATSPSARNEARNTLGPAMGKSVRLSGKMIKTPKFTYGNFTAVESSVPVIIPPEKIEEVKTVITSFLKK